MRFSTIILYATLLGALSGVGCAQLLKLQGQASTQAANGITAYCKNTDAAFRLKFEAEMNAKAAPNSATFFCP